MSKKEIKRLTAKQAIALSERDTQSREVSKVLGKVDMIIRLVATAQTYRQVKVLIKQTINIKHHEHHIILTIGW